MKKLIPNVLKAGLIVGTLDIFAALIQFYIKTNKNPITVLNFIASGVFGSDAFTGGTKMAAFGLFFHYLIAFGFTLLFFKLYSRLKVLTPNIFLLGFIYGLFIWLIMQFVVLPLSQAPAMKMNIQGAITAILILVLCIGIPLSWLAQRSTTQLNK